MRFLNTRTGDFQTVGRPEEVRYAILSHVWMVEEQTYGDVCRIQDDVRQARLADPRIPQDAVLQKLGPKIREACKFARQEDDIDLIWIDTCCIDKSSSAELGEAINSMFDWYARSTVCYAFLHDVDVLEDPYLPSSGFRRSRWYTRGWTLQELIAPRIVVFLSSTWRYIGAKHGMAALVEEITGVDQGVLVGTIPVHSVSVARRMFWAAHRTTTRKEDEAYCLLGIFGVSMPIIYGEGPMAFLRLQEKILKRIPDQSIFVWSYAVPIAADEQDVHYEALADDTHYTLLASSPALFSSSGNVVSITKDALAEIIGIHIPPPAYAITSYGLRATFPLIQLANSVFVAVLACQVKGEFLLGLVIKRTKVVDMHSIGVARLDEPLGSWNAHVIAEHSESTCLVYIPLNSDRSALAVPLETPPRAEEIYIVHRPFLPRATPVRPHALPPDPRRFYKLDLSERCAASLASLGYRSSSVSNVDSDKIVITDGLSVLELELALCECSEVPDAAGYFRFAMRPTTQSDDVTPMDTLCEAADPCDLRQGWDHWNVTSCPSPSHSARRYLLPRPAAVTQDVGLEVRLTLTCDYPGDHRYPPRFSLSIEASWYSIDVAPLAHEQRSDVGAQADVTEGSIPDYDYSPRKTTLDECFSAQRERPSCRRPMVDLDLPILGILDPAIGTVSHVTQYDSQDRRR